MDATRGFRRHDAFESTGDGFEPTDDGFVVATTPLTAHVDRVNAHENRVTCRVVVSAPTLSVVVSDEDVARVVEDGWYETFTLRIKDVGGVTSADVNTPVVARDGDTVRVEIEVSAYPDGVADAAKAVVDYVEGTYIEGAIPGYEYVDPMAVLLDRARSTGDFETIEE